MKQTTPFLDALGLDETADARTIRRAYARRVKLIDQGADALGFQALREAYETALDWAAWQEQEQEPTTAPLLAATDRGVAPAPEGNDAAAPASAPPLSPEEAGEPVEPEVPEEVKLAAAVWERFEGDMTRLAQEGRLADPDAWHALLLARLQDDELVNIGARMQFEWRIVYTLANGWRPGHEALFPAAVGAFDWAQDRRRLAQFGYVGNLVNAAIDERALYDSQAIAVRSVQDRVAMLLRRDKQADRREIVNSMGELRTMQQCFPALLLVVTNADKVAHWEAEYAAHAATHVPRKASRTKGLAVLLLATLAVFQVLRAVHNGASDTAPPLQGPKSVVTMPAPASDPPAGLPTWPQFFAHMAPLNYQPPPNAEPGQYRVEFEVFLDADGKVSGMNKVTESGLPGFDAAVEAAIRGAKPFPPSIARNFNSHMAFEVTPPARQPGAMPPTKNI